MSLAEDAATENSCVLLSPTSGLGTILHAEPFQCSTRVSYPPANDSHRPGVGGRRGSPWSGDDDRAGLLLPMSAGDEMDERCAAMPP